jgi:hypothetical protein
VRTTLDSTRVHIRPGRPATLDIEVINTSSVIDGVSALVAGIDPTWVQLVHPIVSLFPEASGTLTFRFDVPTSCPAGDMPLVVRVFSTIDAEVVEEHDICLVVEPVEAAELQLRPSLVNGGKSATIQAFIINTGNVATEFSIDALEPTRVLTCHTSPPTMLVEPGTESAVTVVARGKRPWIGSPASRNIAVTAVSPSIELTETGRFNQRPRIPRGLLTALILIGIIALWAFIFLWVIQALGKTAAPTKTVAAGFLDGSTKIALENVAGQVSGRVTASTTGEGLERITVEAYRIGRSGQSPQSVASSATDAQGTYAIGSLLPGAYRLRFTADGYTAMWCTPTGGGTTLNIAPSTPGIADPVCNVVLKGRLGAITIPVQLPDGATGTPVVTVQQVVPAGAAQPPAATAVQQPNGTFLAAGLATPAQYAVTVAIPNFAPQTSTVTLAGGQSPVIDPPSLVANTGVISGVVTDAAGTALGGVTVTLRSGALERTITTPTVAGSVGQYRFDALATPRDYILTFTLKGYSSSTRSLVLGAGQSSIGVPVPLVGGQGTLAGIVKDATGTTVGGVVVTVSDANFTANTASLTGGLTNGTYSLAGLPTPGVYTVQFTAPGYRTEYQTVSYLAPGKQTVNVVMTRSVANIRSTVLINGTPAAGVGVTLSNGTSTATGPTALTTVTAANPSGSFSLLGIPPGTYTITLSPPATTPGTAPVVTAVQIITLTAGQTYTASFSAPGG